MSSSSGSCQSISGESTKHFEVSHGNEVIHNMIFFFPRVRTPCGHGAQVIVEGRESQSDGGENNKDHNNNPKTTNKGPQAESPPSCSLSSVLGETGETRKSV